MNTQIKFYLSYHCIQFSLKYLRINSEYLDSLNCGEYLASKKFWKEGIFKITNKYRNGGAHDSAITMETAIECMNYILGNEEFDGVLKKIVS